MLLGAYRAGNPIHFFVRQKYLVAKPSGHFGMRFMILSQTLEVLMSVPEVVFGLLNGAETGWKQ